MVQAPNLSRVGAWYRGEAKLGARPVPHSQVPQHLALTRGRELLAHRRLRNGHVRTAARREVLAELVERVEPVRVAYGRFRATITKWTDTGEAQREMAASLAGGAG